MPKITVVGAGFVGRTTAMRLAEKALGEVVLVDVIEDWPQGLAMDLAHSAPIEGFVTSIIGANDYGPTEGSDVAIITAGSPRSPGMSRADLSEKNGRVVAEVCRNISDHSPQAVVIVVTNPVDEMTHLTAQETGFQKQRVMGMAGILDSARLKVFIAEAAGVSPLDVDALCLGSHGDEMVPVRSLAKVRGKPLSKVLDSNQWQKVCQKTVDAGAEIVRLLGKGSAFYAPSAAAAQMAAAVLLDNGEIHPVAAWTDGPYGIVETYVGVPARLGKGGVEEIVELVLSPDELDQLRQAAKSIKSRTNS